MSVYSLYPAPSTRMLLMYSTATNAEAFGCLQALKVGGYDYASVVEELLVSGIYKVIALELLIRH